ncbi:MAG: hypothetical protein ACK6C0_12615 [Betaproteobacteria bacterium]
MSAVKDAIEAVRAALLLNAEVKRLADAVREQERELRDHDRRLGRIEMMIEIAGQRKLPQQ